LAKLLIAVGEGEFDAVPTEYDIYLDNTPIRDASGNYNFPGVKWDWRPGSVDQAYIPGIPSVENETSLNIELRSDAAWVRSITNTQLSAVRMRLAWPALQRADDEGNVGGYRIEYAIDVATDGGAYQQVLVDAVDGKTTTRYERSRRIDLPDAKPEQQQDRRHHAGGRLYRSHRREAALPEYRTALHRIRRRAVHQHPGRDREVQSAPLDGAEQLRPDPAHLHRDVGWFDEIGLDQ